MQSIFYDRARDVNHALELARQPGAKFIGGGTNLLDLYKSGIEKPVRLVDGQRINACLTLAVMHDGRDITTVEGLGQEGQPHPMQQAFMDCDGFQCGYCTPGQVCSAVALLDEVKARQASMLTEGDQLAPGALSEDEIRERMSGNLCRCGAYPNIVKAIRSVALRQA